MLNKIKKSHENIKRHMKYYFWFFLVIFSVNLFASEEKTDVNRGETELKVSSLEIQNLIDIAKELDAEDYNIYANLILSIQYQLLVE